MIRKVRRIHSKSLMVIAVDLDWNSQYYHLVRSLRQLCFCGAPHVWPLVTSPKPLCTLRNGFKQTRRRCRSYHKRTAPNYKQQNTRAVVLGNTSWNTLSLHRGLPLALFKPLCSRMKSHSATSSCHHRLPKHSSGWGCRWSLLPRRRRETRRRHSYREVTKSLLLTCCFETWKEFVTKDDLFSLPCEEHLLEIPLEAQKRLEIYEFTTCRLVMKCLL